MTKDQKKKDLANLNKTRKEIASPANVDYLANKLKEHDITGIKYERKYANGDSESLAIWRQGGTIKQTLTIKDKE